MKELDREKIKENDEPKRRRYSNPNLIKYGDIRSLTLGGSPGNGDTGPGSGTENPLNLSSEEEETTDLNE